jgi:cytosine/adenosine deaminase-related metal-dependent hydrolase
MPPTTEFDARYTAPVVEALSPEAFGPELAVRAAPEEPVALGGCVITPTQMLEDGWVVIEGQQIAAVQSGKPQGVKPIATKGVICPGLIDLHGHPEFNVFAAWEPPRQFVNRYAWRGSDLYHQLIRDPQDKLTAALPAKTQLRYAEVRALVSGVTAFQGTGGQASTFQDEALVRNVDKLIFGEQVGRSMVDLPAEGHGKDQLDSIVADPSVKAFYIHLAEGQSANKRSREELGKLDGLGGVIEKTVVIHGTALSEADLGQLKDVGAKLVWSPQSNLRLYGETTNAAAAIKLGLPMGLGADWLPSGSTSLLAELKVARRELAHSTGRMPSPRLLVDMVTRTAAKIAGLEDKLGALKPKRAADLVVFERRQDDPWENVVAADPSWVELVMIDGDIAYGHDTLVKQLVGEDRAAGIELQIAWGKRMLLDTSFQVHRDPQAPPKLSELRAALIQGYPAVGPIFA